ncbi:Outer membrane receptor for ferrienterochelin and colicins [Saccharicrinis carchari]|uniref:Outer membrane receptor for ferrienterochelin and colicins n=1 Tax=Saccharicrinis carchari TaxID=1168039 RepID=A0A521F774_SACCC|nr:outer membrane beta-barrel protein [Saccharicrinis carchari]SMO91944.1 Outer membrane receptor for ferrienterochelin and colicins [Saccharicrinis carchari]
MAETGKVSIKTIIVMGLLLISGINMMSEQHQFVIHGKLKDKSTKLPIEFATIAIGCSKNDSIVTSMISDSKGDFVCNVAPGQYEISIRCLGYKPIGKTIHVYKQDIHLKPFNMVIDNNALEEVNVIASSYNEQFDKSIQNITKQFKEGTSNVSDLLAKIRGVDIDPLDNSIRVDNQKNALLLVNGAKKEQKYIKNLSPDRISRIEISRNPTGRYISEGYTSVINIILKKNYTGYDLHLEEKGIYSLDKSNGDDFLFSNLASVDLTYTFKKVNIYGSYTNMKANTNLFVKNIKILEESKLVKEPVTSSPNSKRDGFLHTYLLGADIFISPKQTISLETNIIQSPIEKNNTARTYNNALSSLESTEVFTSILTTNQSDKEYYSQLTYRNRFSEKNKLELDYSYNFTESELLNNYIEDTGTETKQKLISNRTSSIVDLNFKHLFNDTYTMEGGYKNTYRSYDYEYLSLMQEPNIEVNKDIRNLIYTYFSFTPEGKIKTKIGIAVEQNILKANNKSNYNYSPQPFFSLCYKRNRNLNVTLKINSDSRYPYTKQVSPNELTIDRLSSEIGIPNLNYSTRYVSSLDFKLLKNSLSIEPFYIYTNNYISKTGDIKDDHFKYSYSNLDKYESYGLKMSAKLFIVPKKISFNLTASLYKDKTEFGNHTNDLTDYTMNVNIMYLSSKHKTIYAMTLKRMNAKQIQAYGYYNNDNDHIGCIVRQPFFQQKMAVTFLYLLPVSSGLDYSMNSYFEHSSFREQSTTNVGMLKNLFMVNLSFNLNKGNEIKSVEKRNYKEKRMTKGFF